MRDESLAFPDSVPTQEDGSSSVSAQKLLLQAKMCALFALEDRQSLFATFVVH